MLQLSATGPHPRRAASCSRQCRQRRQVRRAMAVRERPHETRGAARAGIAATKHLPRACVGALAAAAALATLDTLESGLYARAEALGKRIQEGLARALRGCNHVHEIRGKGLMIGIELTQPAPKLVQAGLDAGILINVTQERVVRLLPPLILTDAEADDLVDRVAELIRGIA